MCVGKVHWLCNFYVIPLSFPRVSSFDLCVCVCVEIYRHSTTKFFACMLLQLVCTSNYILITVLRLLPVPPSTIYLSHMHYTRRRETMMMQMRYVQNFSTKGCTRQLASIQQAISSGLDESDIKNVTAWLWWTKELSDDDFFFILINASRWLDFVVSLRNFSG